VFKCEVWFEGKRYDEFKWIRGWDLCCSLLRDLEIEVDEFISKVSEWFDKCDILKIKYNGEKNKIIKLSLILKII